jgi:truncated hemoglobin YjbI
MSIGRVKLSGRAFHQKVGRDTHFRAIFSIFYQGKGIEYVPLALTYKRGQFTDDHARAMRDLRKFIKQPFGSPEFRKEALDLLYKEVFETVKKRGKNTRMTEELQKRLTAVARELVIHEKTPMPRKGEVLLVTIPFDGNGQVGITNTHRVTLNAKDPMRIIGDTVKDVVTWTTMIYAETYKIQGLE